MNASKLTSQKNRREGRKKGKAPQQGQALKNISACLSSISLRSSSLPWWGLTPPRGQAPVDVVHVHVLTLKHAPGIRNAAENATSEALRRFARCSRGRNE